MFLRERESTFHEPIVEMFIIQPMSLIHPMLKIQAEENLVLVFQAGPKVWCQLFTT